jgi:hypothetical protein
MSFVYSFFAMLAHYFQQVFSGTSNHSDEVPPMEMEVLPPCPPQPPPRVSLTPVPGFVYEPPAVIPPPELLHCPRSYYVKETKRWELFYLRTVWGDYWPWMDRLQFKTSKSEPQYPGFYWVMHTQAEYDYVEWLRAKDNAYGIQKLFWISEWVFHYVDFLSHEFYFFFGFHLFIVWLRLDYSGCISKLSGQELGGVELRGDLRGGKV